jgi:hypothetical protein
VVYVMFSAIWGFISSFHMFFVFLPSCRSGSIVVVGGGMILGRLRYHAHESYDVLIPCFVFSSSFVLFFITRLILLQDEFLAPIC